MGLDKQKSPGALICPTGLSKNSVVAKGRRKQFAEISDDALKLLFPAQGRKFRRTASCAQNAHARWLERMSAASAEAVGYGVNP
jgi:hypothetical protein